MTLDAKQAALVVRVTARISAGLLAANLLVSARRITDGRGVYRSADVRHFVAFFASHTMHFICVGLLALATNGANLESPLGYAPSILVGLLFHVGCAGILRVKMRDGDRRSTRSERNTELWLLVAVWLGFAQTYVPRLFQSPLFTALGVSFVHDRHRLRVRSIDCGEHVPGFEPRAERGEALFRNAAHARDRIIVGIRRHVAVHLEPILEILAVQGQMSGEVRVLNAWQTAVLRGRSAAGIVQ